MAWFLSHIYWQARGVGAVGPGESSPWMCRRFKFRVRRHHSPPAGICPAYFVSLTQHWGGPTRSSCSAAALALQEHWQ